MLSAVKVGKISLSYSGKILNKRALANYLKKEGHSLSLKHTDADRRGVMKKFVKLSKKIDAAIIPVCETVRLCYAEQPEIIWHNTDGVHMGMHGGYAVACTFYAALTGGAKFPPPAILVQQVKIDPEIALFIQEKAIQSVDNYYKK